MLPEGRVTGLGAGIGEALDPGALDALENECQPPAARRDALRHLAIAERTGVQLSGYLSGRGYSPHVVETVVSWAREHRFVDDGRYAASFLASRSGRSPMGSGRIRQELRRRGVPDAAVDSVLADREDGDLFATLVETVRKRYGRLPREVGFRRAAGYLSRRGFSGELSLRVLAHALRGEEEGEEPG